jgi:hypothetical protein
MRAWVKERLSAEAMVAGYERVYQQVLPVAMKRFGSFAAEKPRKKVLAPTGLDHYSTRAAAGQRLAVSDARLVLSPARLAWLLVSGSNRPAMTGRIPCRGQGP